MTTARVWIVRISLLLVVCFIWFTFFTAPQDEESSCPACIQKPCIQEPCEPCIPKPCIKEPCIQEPCIQKPCEPCVQEPCNCPSPVSGNDLSEVEKCLLEGGKQCWREYKHKMWLQSLANIEKRPLAELHRFQDPTQDWAGFFLLEPTHECDPNYLVRVGAGDGGKWICGPLDIGQDCVIMSLGSNGNFEFEQNMQKFTQQRCKFHTFDCTGTWSDPSTNFHPWCIGPEDKTDEHGRIFKRMSTIIKELQIPRITLLKADIECYEFKVLPDMFAEAESSEFPVPLPQHILLEVHIGNPPINHQLAELPAHHNWYEPMVRFGRVLDKGGYRIAIRENNVLCKSCAEFVLVHKDIK